VRDAFEVIGHPKYRNPSSCICRVDDGYEWYWREIFLKAKANQKLLPNYTMTEERLNNLVLMNDEHELIK